MAWSVVDHPHGKCIKLGGNNLALSKLFHSCCFECLFLPICLISVPPEGNFITVNVVRNLEPQKIRGFILDDRFQHSYMTSLNGTHLHRTTGDGITSAF